MKSLLALIAVACLACVTADIPLSKEVTVDVTVKPESVIAETTSSDLFDLAEWLVGKPADSWDSVLQEGESYRIIERKVSREKNLTGHDNFKYRWDERYISIVMLETEENLRIAPEIYFTTKQYQDLVSAGSRQMVLWNMVEADRDGVVDVWGREYFLSFNCVEDDPLYTFIMPMYPEGFRNFEWSAPPRQEAQVLFDELVCWWLEQSKIVRQGV